MITSAFTNGHSESFNKSYFWGFEVPLDALAPCHTGYSRPCTTWNFRPLLPVQGWYAGSWLSWALARNPANEVHHGSVTALDPIESWVSDSPSLSLVQHSRMHTGFIQPTSGCKVQVYWRKDRAQLPELTPGNSTPSNNWKKSHMAAI